ncbi:histidine kinase [Streptomyces sp. NPDC050738]|uniref:sensor histidine kinase n=1 Tax=Streptomyces sp. NPDC050738 TaxID=3154744 RepID=UPI0034155C4D
MSTSGSPQGDALTRSFRRLVERVRAFDVRRPWVWNLTVAACCMIATLTDATAGWQNTARNPDADQTLVVLIAIGIALPLYWRRRHPLLVLAATTPALAADNWSGALLQTALLTMLPVFNLALRARIPVLAWSVLLLVAPIVLATPGIPHADWNRELVPQLYGYVLASAAGIAVRARRESTEALMERARRLEVERDQQARLAAAAERTRIAREMHDIVGHHLSVITGLADGGSYAAAKRPERAGQALTAISATSREALAELRRLLGVLHDDDQPGNDAELVPQPGLDDLEQLLEGVRAAGLPVHLAYEGERPDGESSGRQLTVYRVVQEALTNSLKHGPASAAEVLLRQTPTALTAEITDYAAATLASAHDEGRGITGMRERTAMYAGTLEAGPRTDGRPGWTVRLTLPTPAPLASPNPTPEHQR